MAGGIKLYWKSDERTSNRSSVQQISSNSEYFIWQCRVITRNAVREFDRYFSWRNQTAEKALDYLIKSGVK